MCDSILSYSVCTDGANLKSNPTQISDLSRNWFKSFSQISYPHFSSNPKSFKVKSQMKQQIFHENEYVNTFSTESRHTNICALYFSTNHTRYISCSHRTYTVLISQLVYGAVLALNCVRSISILMIHAFHFMSANKHLICSDLNF